MAGARIWAHQTPAASYADSFRGAVWSPTLRLWLIVGDNAGLQTSPDGETWTLQTAAGMVGTDDITAAAWMAGAAVPRLVIVGDDGLVYTSADGITWTVRALDDIATDMKGIAWAEDDGVLVAVGSQSESGHIETSPDGEAWTDRTTSFSPLRAVAIGVVYVAVGGGGSIHTSDDQGATWTSRTADGGYSGTFQAAVWSPELQLFVISGADAEVQTSPDGITWTSRVSGTGTIEGLAWSPVDELFIFCVDRTIWASADGTTWTQQIVDPPYAGSFLAVSVGLSNFVAVGSLGEIQISESLAVDPKHAEHFKQLLPRGVAWGRRS